MSREWAPWLFIAGFQAVYGGAWLLGGWVGRRQNRKHGPLR